MATTKINIGLLFWILCKLLYDPLNEERIRTKRNKNNKKERAQLYPLHFNIFFSLLLVNRMTKFLLGAI